MWRLRSHFQSFQRNKQYELTSQETYISPFAVLEHNKNLTIALYICVNVPRDPSFLPTQTLRVLRDPDSEWRVKWFRWFWVWKLWNARSKLTSYSDLLYPRSHSTDFLVTMGIFVPIYRTGRFPARASTRLGLKYCPVQWNGPKVPVGNNKWVELLLFWHATTLSVPVPANIG